MSYQFYTVLHLLGVFMVIAALSSMALHVASGGTKAFPNRKLLGAVHGIGLLIALVGGFGLLARLGLVGGIPGWALAKLVVWFILGGLPALIYRLPKFAKLFWLLVFAFAILNTYLAVFKPF